ncbi:NAD(P)-dependent alcohol dehydrogenase [Phycicoccus sp. BSK3Z-2]|uniref:NAD(P)-dependent alcohol dehydrogenase n=1 Tax=Phycicoccus avicenniae TaxID=2828860 RepID=A0A941D9E0_9MICO|nr:NAD(P)-dependent alcohol dehydrogenase [Phycicoccus avicenniae]MBR7744343.1 NAD(P)-dependent alcohol dehydrogenase [Phycicoccus avicenniae]
MRAAVVTGYGPPEVVDVVEVADPAPGPGQVLVRVEAVAVSAGDARIRGARFPRGFGLPGRLALGWSRPRRPVLGAALSGVVVATGEGVGDLAPGDAVCAMNGTRMGGHAELAVLDGTRVVRLPDGVDHRTAAGLLFGGTTALPYLRDKGRMRLGARVLVVGAGGEVGTSALQVARLLGGDVTAVTHRDNADLVGRLGATTVLDREATDVTALHERFDVVLDTGGTLTPRTGRRLLTPEGRLLLVAADLPQTLQAVGRVQAGPAPERTADVEALLGWAAAGSLRAVVDSEYALDDVVAAHARVDTGRKVGTVLLLPRASR